MGLTDIEHDGLPRVCFQWAGEDGNHRCLVRKPKTPRPPAEINAGEEETNRSLRLPDRRTINISC